MNAATHMSSERVRVRIVHETDPQKYFPAILELGDRGLISICGSHRYSVVKEWVRAGLKDRRPMLARSQQALSDMVFRLRIPFVSGETIVFGWAPWDWRILIYAPLVRKNHVVYHTSWPHWGRNEVPRTYGPLTALLRRVWVAFLRHPHVRVVAVLEATRVDLQSELAIESTVIPHAVPGAFFDAAEGRSGAADIGVRLLYVGELSTKKGVDLLLRLMRRVQDAPVTLTLVGDGVLRDRCSAADTALDSVTYLGRINDRRELAAIMARHDVLVLPSLREGAWEELFGIVVTEAIAAGMGVIASRHVGPSAILGQTHPRSLIAEGDEDGLERLVRSLAGGGDALQAFLSGHGGIADRYRMETVSATWLTCLTHAESCTSDE